MRERDIAAWAQLLDHKLTASSSSPTSPPQVRPARRRPRMRLRSVPALALGLGVGWALTATPERPIPLETALHDLRAVTPASGLPDCVRPRGDGTIGLSGTCAWPLASPAMTVASFGDASVRVEGDVVTVLDGWLVFDVERVQEGAPSVRVGVAGGMIEVLGTRFSVYQERTRGHVELVEGRIRMLEHSGVASTLSPGDRFTWHSVASAELQTAVERLPSAAAPDGQVTSRPRTPRRASEPIREIAALRAEGRYLEALDLARRWASDSRSARTREVLHYEAGTLIEGPMGDASAACRHWREHLARYPKGRYTEQVALRLARLGCPP